MSRRALFTYTAGPPSTQHHPVTAVADVRLQQQQPAGWHSPVPYLFGGLAVMLGLIAFALLILACSYWKLSAFPESSDAESGEEKAGCKAGKVEEEGREMSNVVVIMAGQLKPTFIATPSTSRTSSFGDSVNGDKGPTTSSASSDDTELPSSEDDQVRRGSRDHHDALHQRHQLHPNPARGDLPV